MLIEENKGWFGGTILDLAIKNDVVLAASLAGIYRSVNGGQSWKRVGHNLPDAFTQAVAITKDPESDLAVAASNAGWLYISHDQGETWEIVSSWRNVGSITRVGLSPTVSSDGMVLVCSGENGIYKSTDYGHTWKPANFGLLNLSVLSLAFSPAFEQDEAILIGTDRGGLFRSRNAARAWRESGAGLPDATVQSIAFSPHYREDGTVFIGLDEGGLYCSTDKARTWSLVSDVLLDTSIISIILMSDWASGGRMLLAADDGVWESVDAGVSWVCLDASISDTYALVCAHEMCLVGSYQQGIHRSREGRNWELSNTGLAGHLPPLAVFSEDFVHDHSLVMASADGELVRSQDGGQSWEHLALDLEAGMTIMTGTGAGSDMSLFAATGSELMNSPNSGEVWESILDVEASITALSLTGEGVPWIGTVDGRVICYQHQSGAANPRYIYDDEAVIALYNDYAVAAHPTQAGVWQLSLHVNGPGDALVAHTATQPTAIMEVDPNTGLLFCALGSRIFCIQDGAVLSQSDLIDSEPASCLAVHKGQVYVGTRSGLSISSDNGQTWETTAVVGPVVALHVDGAEHVNVVSLGGFLFSIRLP